MNLDDKTERICDCAVLVHAAREPRIPIEFDGDLREYNIVLGPSKTRMSYCPFCGGKLPESLRATLFSHVPMEEKDRLFTLVRGLKTEAELLARLGKPDLDRPKGTVTWGPEVQGQPERTVAYRSVIYTQLSTIADLCVDLYPDGGVASCMVLAKYVGPPSSAA
jgi:hypothetical protein